MPMIFSANRSKVLVEGEPVEGLQSLAFRVATATQAIPAVGQNERIDLVFGLRTVHGELIVRSLNPKLDLHLQAQSKFQIVAELKKEEGDKAPRRTLSFDDCYVEGKAFALDANGSAVTTYSFSASRVREE